MNALELSALAIVALYVVGRTVTAAEPRRMLVRFGLLAAASWASEQSAIAAYDAYGYAPSWSLFAGHVPVTVALIWPCVIHGAYDLAGALLGTRSQSHLGPDGSSGARPGPHDRSWIGVAVLAGLLVLADASLIEPISVRAGLWHWRDPGLFSVPFIGLLGWAFHAAGCIAVLESVRVQHRRSGLEVLVLLAGPIATHAGLLGAWWGALRWLPGEINPWIAVVVVWGVSLVCTVEAYRRGARHRVPSAELWLRVPAASFFLVLLLLYGRRSPALVAYAAAFVPPWIALLRLPTRRPRPLDEAVRVR